ncbi:MAG: tetratricopeptide repeat protein [Defluviitaleaceae bacterium]|nr:tetratricopeptide repeat protein [Defluviitaleaceae bacterium]
MELRIISTKDGKNLFQVSKVENNITEHDSKEIEIPSPNDFKVGTTTLKEELRWYLEDYMKTPYGGFVTQADNAMSALSKWGRDCFTALFDSGGQTQDWYRDATRNGLHNLRITIVSDDKKSHVLSWPWEALEDSNKEKLAFRCQITRQTIIRNYTPPVKPIDGEFNMLYVIARPADDRIGLRVLAQPLINFVHEDGWPVHIEILRPPTYDQFLKALAAKQYHLIHFDGHGGFNKEGMLEFETEDGKADYISATNLGTMLARHNIPAMVLNACRSAAFDENAFASVAVSLLKAGVRSVVAMGHNLLVSGAKMFVPAFYEQLFMSGDISKAMFEGRLKMFSQRERDAFMGKTDFQDWIVPILYKQGEDFLPKLETEDTPDSKLPPEADIGSYDFIGRDSYIQEMERAMRRPPAGILIHGMAGEGKTTLAKGFLQWLEKTHGLGVKAFWFSFEKIYGAGGVINILAGEVLGVNAMSLPAEEMLAALVKHLKKHKYVLVWDNFESASGIEGTEVSAQIKEESERQQLKQFLSLLRGGETKVIITSRKKESWLPPVDCYKVQLKGLEGDELWQYCNVVLRDLGRTLDREDKDFEDYCKLLDMLAGNPLSIRIILLRLTEQGNTIQKLIEQLEQGFNTIEGDENTKRIQSALAIFEKGLDPAFAPILRVLGLHEHHAGVGFIGVMLGEQVTETLLNDCFKVLENAGVCRPFGNNVYQLHPALRGCLSRLHPATHEEKQAFVNVMCRVADIYMRVESLHARRYVFGLFSANFHRAWGLAMELDMQEDMAIVMEALARYARERYNFSEAIRINKLRVKFAKDSNNEKEESIVYSQLGHVALLQQDFDTAEMWYEKSLDIAANLNEESGMAVIYHELGRIAEKRRNSVSAEKWYKQSLDISLKLGNESSAAKTYHHLGMIEGEQKNFDSAKKLYNQSLDIKLKLGNEAGMAKTYHQLGGIEEKQGNFDAAKDLYNQSLDIKLKLGNEAGMAKTYHQLGGIEEKQGNFDAAKDLYKQSLDIKLKIGDESDAANTYGQLGSIEEKQQNYNAAKRWYKQTLDIKFKLGDNHGVALTYVNLGVLADETGEYAIAENWFKQALPIFEAYNDTYHVDMVINNLIILYAKMFNLDLDAPDFPEKLTQALQARESGLLE